MLAWRWALVSNPLLHLNMFLLLWTMRVGGWFFPLLPREPHVVEVLEWYCKAIFCFHGHIIPKKTHSLLSNFFPLLSRNPLFWYKVLDSITKKYEVNQTQHGCCNQHGNKLANKCTHDKNNAFTTWICWHIYNFSTLLLDCKFYNIDIFEICDMFPKFK